MNESGERLGKRQQDAVRALRRLGGEASTRQVAEALGRSVNGVSQTLGAHSLRETVAIVSDGSRGGDTRWLLIVREVPQPELEPGELSIDDSNEQRLF